MQHCETTTLGVLLRHEGIELSEPMIFGLGSGLGFIIWDTFLGGRVKPFVLTQNLVARLGLTMDARETTSPRKAWQNVATFLDEGRPVGLQLDSYHLEYFTSKVHFGGHFAAIHGYDGQNAYLVDTEQQGGKVTTSLDSLAAARSERGPMTARNRSFTITGTPRDPADVILPAIRANAAEFLNPPIANLGHRGIAKAAKVPLPPEVAIFMERAGTGGALFRNLYRDFLAEAATILDDPRLREAHARYAEIAPLWTQAAQAIERGDPPTEIMLDLAVREREAMEILAM
ncbi:BtrH N-terminal domain-containing protein [Nonomuraea sp. NPDC050556]|uniref:BtrH N-terminal domain-containing protein n=1 Tax=Nonomuraea sp. NPDC050556 TaxID=3364369 RepID=UPI0037B2EFBF